MVLKPVDTAQSLTFYIRPMVNTSNEYRIVLRNEATSVAQTVTPTLTASTTYLRTFTASFSDLTEATWYNIYLYEYSGGENIKRLYFGRAYVTAQTDYDKYTRNSGRYTEYDAGAGSRQYIEY